MNAMPTPMVKVGSVRTGSGLARQPFIDNAAGESECGGESEPGNKDENAEAFDDIDQGGGGVGVGVGGAIVHVDGEHDHGKGPVILYGVDGAGAPLKVGNVDDCGSNGGATAVDRDGSQLGTSRHNDALVEGAEPRSAPVTEHQQHEDLKLFHRFPIERVNDCTNADFVSDGRRWFAPDSPDVLHW
jgi:hypothetical protein